MKIGCFHCRVTHSVNILLGSTKVSQRLWHKFTILYSINMLRSINMKSNFNYGLSNIWFTLTKDSRPRLIDTNWEQSQINLHHPSSRQGQIMPWIPCVGILGILEGVRAILLIILTDVIWFAQTQSWSNSHRSLKQEVDLIAWSIVSANAL